MICQLHAVIYRVKVQYSSCLHGCDGVNDSERVLCIVAESGMTRFVSRM